MSDITRRALFNASYTTTERVAKGWTQSTVWQYSGKGRVEGIPSDVDLNVYRGSMDNLIAWLHSPDRLRSQSKAQTVDPTIVSHYSVSNPTGTYSSQPSWAGQGRWVAYLSPVDIDNTFIDPAWAKVVTAVISQK